MTHTELGKSTLCIYLINFLKHCNLHYMLLFYYLEIFWAWVFLFVKGKKPHFASLGLDDHSEIVAYQSYT